MRLTLVATLAITASACAGSPDHAFSGTLQSVSANVGSTVGGRVVAVSVADGDRVRAGEAIVRLDDVSQRAELAAARGRLAQAQTTLQELLNGSRRSDIERAAALAAQAHNTYMKTRLSGARTIAIDEQNVRQAEADVRGAGSAYEERSRNDERQRALFAHGAISAQARDASAASLASAEAALHGAQARLTATRVALRDDRTVSVPRETAAALDEYRAAEAQLRTLQEGSRPEEIEHARAAVATARAEVEAARKQLDEMIVRAPADGVVSGLDLHVGDLVGAGMGVATLDERGDPYVRVYVPQPLLAGVRVGQHVKVQAEALGGRSFDGVIEQIDERAQFTPQNVQTAEDRANLTFGVKVRVHDPGYALHGGTTAMVMFP